MEQTKGGDEQKRGQRERVRDGEERKNQRNTAYKFLSEKRNANYSKKLHQG